MGDDKGNVGGTGRGGKHRGGEGDTGNDCGDVVWPDVVVELVDMGKCSGFCWERMGVLVFSRMHQE